MFLNVILYNANDNNILPDLNKSNIYIYICIYIYIYIFVICFYV